MRVGAASLKSMLNQSILDIRFTRRTPKAGKPNTRRMLCTNAPQFLSTIAAKSVFGFSAPSGAPKYNAASKGLVIAYDLFMQNFGAINGSNVEILNVYPVTNEQQINEFWDFFSQNVSPMSASDKDKFMDS